MIIKEPFQFSKYGNLIKSVLHTKIGAFLGYHLGVRGFNRIESVHTSIATGKIVRTFAYNARVAKGGDLVASLLTGAAQNGITSPLPPKFIALSTSTLTPANGDTTLAGETAVAGLARAIGTIGGYVAPSVLDGACSYTVTKTFTLTGTATTIVSTALFDAVTVGNLFAESNLLTSSVMATGDTLTIIWTVNM